MHRTFDLLRFDADYVRKSLRRACGRVADGMGAVSLDIELKELSPDIAKLGLIFQAWSLGSVINGCLEILDPTITEEQAEEGENLELYIPLKAIKSCRVMYVAPDFRNLDAAGCFDFLDKTYQVKEIWSCKVEVLQEHPDGAVWVEDLRDGEIYKAEIFKPMFLPLPPAAIISSPAPIS